MELSRLLAEHGPSGFDGLLAEGNAPVQLDHIHVRVEAFEEGDGRSAIPSEAVPDAAGPLLFTRVEDDGAVAGIEWRPGSARWPAPRR